VFSAASRSGCSGLGFTARAINVGDPPTDARWPDGKTSKERFRNLRAELWWKLRERFEKTFAYVMYISGDDNGINYPVDELISIPEHSELIAQLSLPLYFYTDTGKIQIESKKDMQKRGVSSPDFADALVLAFAISARRTVLPSSERPDWVRKYDNW
jgi:phage terminase large subunit